MPPLARTNAGLTWATTSRTVLTRAALTVRAMTRLSTASAAGDQSAAGADHHISRGVLGPQQVRRPGGGVADMLVPVLGLQQGRNIELQLDDVPFGPEAVQLSGGQSYMGSDRDQPVLGFRARLASFMRRGGQDRGQTARVDGRRGPLTAAGPHERRARTVHKILAGRLCPQQRDHDHLQVGVLSRVDHDRLSVAQPRQNLLDPIGSAFTDVGQGDGGHVVPGDPTTGLLLDPIAQIGVEVAEAGVLGELAVRGRDHAVAGPRPVQRVDGHPARLDVGRTDQHAVNRRTTSGQLLGEHVGLERVVAAERGIAPAGNDVGDPFQPSRLVQSVNDLAVALHYIRLGQTACVGQDEKCRRGLVQGPLQVGHRPAGQHRKIGDALGTGGIVVEHHQPTTRPNLVQRDIDMQHRRLVCKHPFERNRAGKGW